MAKRIQASSSPYALSNAIRGIVGKQGDAFVLTIGDEGAVLAYIKRGQTERRVFAARADAADTGAMTDMLKLVVATPIYILLDVMDQHYVRQTFPPVSAMSLNKIVQRRLDRDLPADDIKGAIRLGRDSGGRKEWQYLLASISMSPELQAWLDWVLAQENSFKGMYLLPLETTKFLPKLKEACADTIKAPWQILFMHTKVGGFRQVVLQHGRLVFTRISQVQENSAPDFLAGSVEQEIQNTLDYLRRFDLDSNQEIEIYVVVGSEIKSSVDLKRFNFLHAELLTPHETSQLLNQENTALYADNYTDMIFAHAFLSSAHVKCFMPQAAQRIVALEKMIYGAKFLALFVVMICVVLSLFSVINYIGSQSEIASAEAKTSALNMQKVKLQKIVDNQQDSEKIAASVTTLQEVKKLGELHPFDFVKELAPVIAPDAIVTSIEWQKLNLPTSGVYVTGPVDVDILVTLEFLGNYSDDVAYAVVANAQNDALIRAFPRYKVEAVGLPGAQGDSKLEIDFNAGRFKDVETKKRIIQIKFRGLLPKTASNYRDAARGVQV